MRTFQCFKRVKAAQIVEVIPAPNLAGMLGDYAEQGEEIRGNPTLRLDNGETVPHPNTTKYQPVAGDYIVQYEDGYRSVSPKSSFEDGYRELPSEDELAQAVAFTVQPHIGADAQAKPTIEHGAIIGVQVIKNGCTYQELTSEPLTDELACLLFGCKAGMAIADRMGPA